MSLSLRVPFSASASASDSTLVFVPVGIMISTLALQRRADSENVVSYLSLRVHGSTALCVRSLSAEPI